MTPSSLLTSWLPQTKLIPPQAGEGTFPRPALLAQVGGAMRANRLTLLSAPAGSGKTTLLSCLARENQDFPFAWMTVDEDDNDPGSFLRLFILSLQRIFPECGKTVEQVYREGISQEVAIRRALAALINDVLALAPQPFGLVIDDLHLLTDPLVLQGLDYLLDHLPPFMHVLATARHDPALSIPRLRARGHLAEFRLEQLRFTREELSGWLNDGLGLDLSEQNLGTLYNQTEGWAAGLRLLVLSLDRAHGSLQRDALFTRLEQGQRHIYDFLMQEVLLQQAPERRRFLLQTSILLELTPQSCQSVTGQADAREVLEDLYNRNLFLTLSNDVTTGDRPLHEGQASGPTYRYHALFADFLQQQLRREMPDCLPDLYHKAAEAQSSPARAIHYYLAGELWEPACQALEVQARERIGSGDYGQMVRWMRAIPEAAREAHPWLNLLLSADAVQRGHYDAAQPYLEGLLPTLQEQQDEEGQTEALVQMGEIYTCLALTDKSGPALEQLATRPLTSARRTKALANQAWTTFYRGDWEPAEARFLGLLAEVERSNDIGSWSSLILSLGPQHAHVRGGVRLLESFCQKALAQFGEGTGAIQAGAKSYLGYLRFLQGQLADARRFADEARALCEELGGLAHLDIYIDHVTIFDALYQRNLSACASFLDQRLLQLPDRLTQRQFLATYLYLRSLVASLQGQPELVHALRERLQAEHIAYEVPDAASAHLLLDALAARHSGQFDQAEASLRQAMEIQERFRHTLLMSNARAELACLQWEQGRKEQALETFFPLLMQAARDDMPGLFQQAGTGILPLLEAARGSGVERDLTGKVLGLFAPVPSVENVSPAPKRIRLESGESLSDRELEVLRLIATGLSNQEIAATLFISPGTAKRHSINIYRKLNVNRRTQAIARAQALNLL